MRKRTRGFAQTIILVAFLLIGILIFSFIVLRKNPIETKNPILNSLSKVNIINPPTPTPFPFREMTIPHLRTRSYSSSLNELQKISDNQSYSSYLTSYNSDGLKVYGFLTQPKSEKPKDGFPAIVFVHGYIPPEEYKTRVNYASYVDYLAKNGFVVFKIDLRGHGDSEGEPGGAYYSSDYVVDTLNAYSALQNADFVNSERIGLWGHSMAGNIVFRSFAAKQEIPAIVIWAGAGYTYTDLQEYMIQDSSYRPPPPDSERAKKRRALRDAYGDFEPNHWFWRQIPATNYLSGLKGAVQLNHAVNDNVVSIDYSRNLDTLLDKTAIPHKLNEYPSGGHNLDGSIFNEAMQNTVKFFKEYL